MKTESPPKKGKLVLIIGPSGVGKSVILKALKERHPQLHFPKSATTRPQRPGEGDDLYRFVSEEEFDSLIENDEMIERALVHGGARYGTLKEEIIPFIEEGKAVVREVDVQGFESITRHDDFSGSDAPYTLESIFILPESKEQLVERIKARAPISENELQNRISSMEKEMSYADRCDHRVINREGQLEESIKSVEEILFASESLR